MKLELAHIRAIRYLSIALAALMLLPLAVRADPCPAGSICTLTLDNLSYTVIGPCDVTSASTISGCRVLATISTTSITEARLAAIGIILLQWIIVGSVHFLPLPIRDPVIRTIVQVIYAGTVGALFAFNIWLYRSMTGIKGNIYQQDPFIHTMIRFAAIGGLCVLFIPFIVQRWNNQESRNT